MRTYTGLNLHGKLAPCENNKATRLLKFKIHLLITQNIN